MGRIFCISKRFTILEEKFLKVFYAAVVLATCKLKQQNLLYLDLTKRRSLTLPTKSTSCIWMAFNLIHALSATTAKMKNLPSAYMLTYKIMACVAGSQRKT